MQSYQESPRSGQSNAAPISQSNKQVNDDSSVNIFGTKVTSIPSLDINQRTEHPLADTTTTVSLISYDPSPEQTTAIITTMSMSMSTEGEEDYELDDFQLSESRSVINLHSASELLINFEKPSISNEENPNSDKDATTMLITKLGDNKGLKDDISLSSTQAGTSEITTEYPQPERSPKRIISKGALSQIIEDSTTLKGLKELQTVTPDEVIKGQYHEIHPGQYHETNPGQYHENHPGQYHESNPGQDLGVDKITVNFDHGEKSRSYNVKANAGDFVIGEVGRIDNNSA